MAASPTLASLVDRVQSWEKRVNMDPVILHVDRRLVVVDKPSGLLSVPGRGAGNQNALVAWLRRRFPEIQVVHRLDRDTSGVIVLARDAEAQRLLSRQFQRREVEKIYVAVVYGFLVADAGRIALPLARDAAQPPRYRVDYAKGRTAVTDYRVLERRGQATRLELTPRTGRSHQLRVHLRELGHPVLGDPLYAHSAAMQLASRLCLHALSLSVGHPDDMRPIRWTAPAPF